MCSARGESADGPIKSFNMPARNEPRVVAFERGMIVSAGEPGVGALADSGGRLVAQAGTAGAYARTVSESDLLA